MYFEYTRICILVFHVHVTKSVYNNICVLLRFLVEIERAFLRIFRKNIVMQPYQF